MGDEISSNLMFTFKYEIVYEFWLTFFGSVSLLFVLFYNMNKIDIESRFCVGPTWFSIVNIPVH